MSSLLSIEDSVETLAAEEITINTLRLIGNSTLLLIYGIFALRILWKYH